MAARIIFVTGTDTGVGKTVVTALLAGYLRAQAQEVGAIKPVCSGSRNDAHILRAALGGQAALDEINPWHFRASVAPLLAARAEESSVRRDEVLAFMRRAASRHDVLLVEGAGGLLSPLGEGFNSRDLIAASRALPVVVCPNRLGAVNQALLVVAALPRGARQVARLVLISQPRPDAASRSNAQLLQESMGGRNRVHLLPWLGARWNLERALLLADVRRVLTAIAAGFTAQERRNSLNPRAQSSLGTWPFL